MQDTTHTKQEKGITTIIIEFLQRLIISSRLRDPIYNKIVNITKAKLIS